MTTNRNHHLLITTGIIFLFIFTGWMTLDDYGMGWDEITRWTWGDQKLEYYQKLLAGDASEMRDAIAADRYPGLFDMSLAAYHSLVGGNRMLSGHFLSILFGALGIASTAWLANSVFGNKVAILSAVFLIVYPRFYGHAMINPKDIPFMATYMLGLACIFWVLKGIIEGRKINWGHFLVCGAACGLAASSRLPGIILLAMAPALWLVAICLLHLKEKRSLNLKNLTVRFASGYGLLVLAAFLILFLYFPRLHYQLFSSFSSATSSQLETAGTMPLLFNGQIMDAKDGPFAYPVRFFIKSTPIWMLILLICGSFYLARPYLEKIRSFGPRLWMQALFIIVSLFPWLYVVFSGASLHDGIRHVLFCVPPLIIVMAYGAVSALGQLKSARKDYFLTGTVILFACILSQIVTLYKLHPYQYVYYNVTAGAKATIPNRYDAEYWCTSSKHLLEQLPHLIPLDPSQPTKVRISGALDSARLFVPSGVVLVNSFEEADYYVSNTNFRIDAIVDGEEIYSITRGGIPIGVIKRLQKTE